MAISHRHRLRGFQIGVDLGTDSGCAHHSGQWSLLADGRHDPGGPHPGLKVENPKPDSLTWNRQGAQQPWSNHLLENEGVGPYVDLPSEVAALWVDPRKTSLKAKDPSRNF